MILAHISMAHISVAQTIAAQMNLTHLNWLIWAGSNKSGSYELGSYDLAQVREHHSEYVLINVIQCNRLENYYFRKNDCFHLY